MFDHFCGLDKVPVLSMFRHDYGVFLILPRSISYKMTLSAISVCGNWYCSTEHQSLAVSIRTGPSNPKSQQIIPGQLVDGRDWFSFSHTHIFSQKRLECNKYHLLFVILQHSVKCPTSLIYLIFTVTLWSKYNQYSHFPEVKSVA